MDYILPNKYSAHVDANTVNNLRNLIKFTSRSHKYFKTTKVNGKVCKVGFALNLETSLLFLSTKLEHVYAQHVSNVS
jgi:hypothetical protein